MSGNISAGLGDSKVSANVSTGSVKAEIKKNLHVKTSSTGTKASVSATGGKTISVTGSNSGTVSIGGKIGPMKASGSVNLYNATKGVGKMVQGGLSYMSDYVSNYFNFD